MARYCRVTNITTQVCSLTVQTKYYNSVALLPGEEIYIRSELCNTKAFLQIGFEVVDAGEFPERTSPTFGEAHNRLISALYEQRPDLYSWNPDKGWPTFFKTKFEFIPGTIFMPIGPGVVPGNPTDVVIRRGDRVENCVFDPDGVSNNQWKVLRNTTGFVTFEDLTTAVESASGDGGSYYSNGFDPNTQGIPVHPTGGTVRPGDQWTVKQNGTFNGQTVSIGDTIVASVPNAMSPADFHVEYNSQQSGNGAGDADFFAEFTAVDWLSGTTLSYPLSVHGVPHTRGRPFEVQVFNDQGEEVWICTATNPVTGEVTVTTDGVSFPGSIIISES